MNPQDYKFTIVFTAIDKMYKVSGYVLVNGKWSLDGAPLVYSNLDGALAAIQRTLPYTTRNKW